MIRIAPADQVLYEVRGTSGYSKFWRHITQKTEFQFHTWWPVMRLKLVSVQGARMALSDSSNAMDDLDWSQLDFGCKTLECRVQVYIIT
jgi:hypothetical protein